MKTKYLVFSGGAGVVVAVVAARALLPGPGSKPEAHHRVAAGTAEQSTEDETERARARAELAMLQTQISDLREQVRTASLSATGGDTREAADAAAPSMTPSERRAASAQRYKEQMAKVEAQFRQEPVDERWASAKASAVQSTVDADPVLRNFARNLECRSRTCRMEVTDDKTAGVTKQLPLFAMHVGSTLGRIQADHVDDPSGGSGTYVLYLSNESPPEQRAREPMAAR